MYFHHTETDRGSIEIQQIFTIFMCINHDVNFSRENCASRDRGCVGLYGVSVIISLVVSFIKIYLDYVYSNIFEA